jgi:hypothetical protein
MSSEDFENLVCLFGPAVIKKNTNFGSAKCDGMLGNETEIPCSWLLISQHNVPVCIVLGQLILLIIPQVCEALINALDAYVKIYMPD